MGYDFKISGGFRVKEDKEYPWPCAAEPKRTHKLFTSDVLTRNKGGTYMKHTGLGTFGHVIPTEDVEPIAGDVHLRLL